MMKRDEAWQILSTQLDNYKRRPYADLLKSVEDVRHYECSSPSGIQYQVDIEVLWDEKSKGTIRVIGMIDDGGILSSLSPLSSDFIMRPDGSLIN